MVKRYDCDWEYGMNIAGDGGWVSYDDYAALQAENERLKAERVNLEQFRKAVQWARMHALTDDFLDGCNRLLNLIDAHKGE